MNRMPRRALPAALLLVLLAPGSAFPLDLGGHDRDGVVVGAVMGHGWNNLAFQLPGSAPVTTDYTSAFTGGLSVGWARSDALVASLGLWGWQKDFSQDVTPVSFRSFQFMLDVAWFPRGQGLWLRGGLGLGDADLTVIAPARRYSAKDTGTVTSLGAGYELRVSGTTAVGLAYDARWLTIDGFESLGDVTSLSQNLSFSFRYYQ